MTLENIFISYEEPIRSNPSREPITITLEGVKRELTTHYLPISQSFILSVPLH